MGKVGDLSRRITKVREELGGGDIYVHYLDCGDGLPMYLSAKIFQMVHL